MHLSNPVTKAAVSSKVVIPFVVESLLNVSPILCLILVCYALLSTFSSLSIALSRILFCQFPLLSQHPKCVHEHG